MWSIVIVFLFFVYFVTNFSSFYQLFPVSDMDLPEVVRQKLIELDDENNQLRAELNRTKISLASRDEILAELEEENIELRKSRKQEDCSSAAQKLLEETISSLRESLREKTNELCESQKHSDDLTKALTEALDTVKEMQRPVTPISESTRVSEPSVSEELGRLQDERDEAVFECQRVTYRLRAIEVERDENAERADAAIDEARELGRHLKALREQVQQLEIELTSSKNNLAFANRGNSMFSEFVDERKRLENDLKTLFARCEKLRRENNQMASELDEARLVALRREGREVSGRCKCQEMTTEIIALRSKLATVDSRLASTHSQLINAVEGKPGQDAQLRALYKSLKIELESIRGERDRLRVERDKLKDDNITLTVKASCAESSERRAKEDVEVLKQQLEIIKERKEIQKIEGSNCNASMETEAHKEKEPEKLIRILRLPLGIGKCPETPAMSSTNQKLKLLCPMETPRTSSLGLRTPADLNITADRSVNDVGFESCEKVPPEIKLKKLRFAEVSLNEDEECSRRESISASELRRAARKQSRRRPIGKIAPVAEPIFSFTVDMNQLKSAKTELINTNTERSSVMDICQSSNSGNEYRSSNELQTDNLENIIDDSMPTVSSMSTQISVLLENREKALSILSNSIETDIDTSQQLESSAIKAFDRTVNALEDVPEEKENTSISECH